MVNSSLARVFVAAKSDFSIDGLLHLMDDSRQIEIVACAEPGDGCWHKFLEKQPDVLLLHADAVDSPVNEFIARIRKASSGTRILVFGQKMSQSFRLDVVMAGASGYINERMSSTHLLQAIETVRNGRLWVERIVMEEIVAHTLEVQELIEKTIVERMDVVRELLTVREATVLRFVLDGLATKAIAMEMSVSEQSVKMHLNRMFAKFGVRSRAQMILQAYARVCPVTNVVRLFRMSLDRRRVGKGQPPLIPDPLA